MSTLLIIGTVTGAALGLVHGCGVYAERLRRVSAVGQSPGPGLRLAALYPAAWTAFLWTAFGSYVLILWLLSLPIWLGHRLASRPLRRVEA